MVVQAFAMQWSTVSQCMPPHICTHESIDTMTVFLVPDVVLLVVYGAIMGPAGPMLALTREYTKGTAGLATSASIVRCLCCVAVHGCVTVLMLYA